MNIKQWDVYFIRTRCNLKRDTPDLRFFRSWIQRIVFRFFWTLRSFRICVDFWNILWNTRWPTMLHRELIVAWVSFSVERNIHVDGVRRMWTFSSSDMASCHLFLNNSYILIIFMALRRLLISEALACCEALSLEKLSFTKTSSSRIARASSLRTNLKFLRIRWTWMLVFNFWIIVSQWAFYKC